MTSSTTTVARVGTGMARDPCVVPAAPLRTMLNDWVMDWNRTRPANGGQYGSLDEPTPVGAIAWLELEAKLPKRTIRRILSGEVVRTELRVAERLLEAIGRPYELSPITGSLQVVPRGRRSDCCSTTELRSLNGAA